MDDLANQTTETTKPRNPEHCYLCGGRVGVFQWTDENGLAHPWCATNATWNYAAPAKEQSNA